jgi:DNA-binding NtrC family response regulator
MPDTPKPSVLIVDDETEILFSLSSLLRREFEVHTAPGGYEALRMLVSHPVQAVLADQRMPGMTGIDLLARIRTEHPDVIRLVFTGYADIRAVIDAINKGQVYQYVTKPWDPDELRLLLRRACAQHELNWERKRLLADLHTHLQRCLAVGEAPPPGQADATTQGTGAGEAEELAQATSHLLERLARALAAA